MFGDQGDNGYQDEEDADEGRAAGGREGSGQDARHHQSSMYSRGSRT